MLSKEILINYFSSGQKEEENFTIGTEHEKFLFDIKTKKPIDFSERGILGIFDILKKNQWIEIKDGDNVVGLKKKTYLLLWNQACRLSFLERHAKTYTKHAKR